jgi:hypothetical protein
MQKRCVGNTAFADELPDSSVLSVKSVIIGVIDWLSGNIIGISVIPDILPVTDSKVSIGYLMTSATDGNRHRLGSVTERLRLSLNIFKMSKCQLTFRL